jgi:putative endonuclease
MSVWRQYCGQQGEQIAVDYLQRQGYRIQQQNYRCRRGEIDIIAWDGTTLVFVEVKTKGQTAFGAPQAMVDYRKQKTMVRVAMTYVQQHQLQNTALRFDVVAIILPSDGRPEVTHVPAAFSPPAYFFY